MSEKKSVVFLTMPTSGTGSLWRLITAIAGDRYKPVKITENYEVAGKSAEIPSWVPEPFGHVYMYNTPHFINPRLADPDLKLITNCRDPRDLACNQYHWALQHPIMNRSEAEIAKFRSKVREEGIDKFVVKQDNNILFRSLRAIASRMQGADTNVLRLSYAQLCLDFDNLLNRLVAFLETPREEVSWDVLERERTTNLHKNPVWIGQAWTGTDTMPGRYLRELQPETIDIINARYRENLAFIKSFELPHLQSLLSTDARPAGALAAPAGQPESQEPADGRRQDSRDTALMIEDARLAVARSDWEGAIEMWNRVKDRMRGSPLPVVEIGEIMIRQGKNEEARAYLTAAQSRFADRPDIDVSLAFLLNRERAWETARLRWEELERKFPDHPRVLTGYAELLWAVKDEETLLPVLERLVARQPDSGAAAILYSRWHLRHGRPDAAIAQLTAAQLRHPNDANIRASLEDARLQGQAQAADAKA